MSQRYTVTVQKENIKLLRAVIADLPPMCEEFFIGIEQNTSILTRLNYAYDLRVFFDYLLAHTNYFDGYAIKDFTYGDLEKVTMHDFEKYMQHLTLYEKDGEEFQNGQPGKERKLSTVRSFYKYYFRHEKIKANTPALLDLPKKVEKPIIRLEIDEVKRLIDTAENGDGLTKNQQRYHAYTKLRDVALITLLLSTGIRVSECVGIDRRDINFKDRSFRITRKGGDQVILYFGDECEKALNEYLKERNKLKPMPGHDDALFLSLQLKRINVRSVQYLVKKYATVVTPLKSISPHKLRSTFGTNLYHETQDIYLVADVLGHSDVNTTRRHYAAQSDDNRRIAADKIKLR